MTWDQDHDIWTAPRAERYVCARCRARRSLFLSRRRDRGLESPPRTVQRLLGSGLGCAAGAEAFTHHGAGDGTGAGWDDASLSRRLR